MAIHLDDIDVKLPQLGFDHGSAATSEACEEIYSLNRTAIFVHITQYRVFCGKVAKSLHGTKRPEQNETHTRSVRESLVIELENWRRNTDTLDLPNTNLTTTMSQDRSSFR